MLNLTNKPLRSANYQGHDRTGRFDMTNISPTIRTNPTINDIHALCLKDENGCLVWTLSTNKGYAQWRVNGKSIKLLRYVTELTYGKPLENQHALHSCDNRACLNPEHLRWGTNSENIADRVNRKRSTTGEKSATAKMDWVLVGFMRDDYAQGLSLRVLAERYGMSLRATHAIVTNFTWVDEAYKPVMRSRGRVGGVSNG